TEVTASLAFGTSTVTDEDGHYRLEYTMGPCPGIYIQHRVMITAVLRFADFSPKAAGGGGIYHHSRPSFDSCNGLADYPPGPGLIGMAAWMEARGIVQSQSTVNVEGDMGVAAFIASGAGRLVNEVPGTLPLAEPALAGPIPQGPSARSYLAPDFSPRLLAELDLDGDGLPHGEDDDEHARLIANPDYSPDNGEPEQVVAVWFGAPPQPDTEPDLTRRPDRLPDLTHQGLVKQLSAADLADTDLYIVRASNGQLLMAREGLTEEELYHASGRLEDGESGFYYRALLRGPRAVDQSTGLLGDWQAATQADPALHDVKADHLRMGERVTVVAINRPSGYIGTTTATVKLPDAGGGRIDFPIDAIRLRPPNLKVDVRRAYDVEAGLTAGEEREHRVGFEGAGLASDRQLVVTTEWLDHDGSAIPAAIPAYTARLAKVVAPEQLGPASASGQVAHFPVEPGRHLQLIQLPQDGPLDAQHYYLHVVGEPPSGHPDFQSTGAGEGPLAYRPANAVPIQVALYDEPASRARSNALAREQRADPNADLPDDAQPAYAWVYRPEMQFSVFDLQPQRLEQGSEGDGTLEVIDLTGDQGDTPLVDPLDPLRLIASLRGSEFAPLEALGPGHELVFSVGAEEVTAHANGAGEWVFDDTAHLAELSTDDLLAVRLYDANDTENVLWEFAFGLKPIGTPRRLSVSADDPAIEVTALLPGMHGDAASDAPSDVTLQWFVDGDGGEFAQDVTTTGSGVSQNVLELPREAGKVYAVGVKVVESTSARYPVGTRAIIGRYRVIPGAPARVDLGWNRAVLPADDTSTVAITASVYDAHDNAVTDGTQVAWEIDGDADIAVAEPETGTADGKVSTTISSGQLVGSFDIEVVAGDEALGELEVNTTALGINATTSTDVLTVGSAETAELTVTAGDAADGTPVRWFSTRGEISGTTTLANGEATATLRPAEGPGTGEVIVSVAGEQAVVPIEHKGTGPVWATLSRAAVVGDATTDGYVDIEQADGSTKSYRYHTSTQLELHGEPGETLELALGTPNRPNAAPAVHFPLRALNDSAGGMHPGSPSADGTHTAAVVGDVSIDDMGLHFDGGHLNVPAQADLAIEDGLFVNMNVRLDPGADASVGDPDDWTGATLIRQGSEANFTYRLRLVRESGQTFVQADVTTNAGSDSLRHTQPLEAERLYKIGFRFTGDRVSLQVEGGAGTEQPEIQTAPFAGRFVVADSRLVVGRALRGSLSHLRIGEESSETSLLSLGGAGETAGSVTFDSSGKAAVGLQSLGRFQGGAQNVGITYQRPGQTTAGYQPLELERDDGNWLIDAVISRADARMTPMERRHFRGRGATVTDTTTSGWFSSLVDSIAEAADTVIDVAKTGAQLVSIVTGIDDFVVLADTLMSLARGATDEISYVEVTFAAVGATLTITTVVSAGSLGPIALPLRQSLGVLKGAIRGLRTAGPSRIYALAKGFGILFKDILNNP
ncbi:Ig-like domain-containing protein, partial [Arhodomonas sp. AD133]|uniref:Ig-like domain-containing protein n=1 Tax=Arhodomonas sp. AD133 TaxID=3415009 RepID=UPI003EBCDA4A